MALQLVITNAGRAAVIDQAKGGFRAVRIAAVGVSPTAVTAAPAATALTNEVKRITTIAGEATATDVTHLTVTDESGDSYIVRSFALYLSDGTLFALYGQPDAIVQKSAQALLLLAIDVVLSAIPAAQLTFGNANFTNPAATTERAGVVELATDDEVENGSDAKRAITPHSAKRLYATLSGAKFTGVVRFGAAEGVRLTGPDGLVSFYSENEQIRRGYLQFYGTSGTLVNDGGGALHLQTGGTNVLTVGPAGIAVSGYLSVTAGISRAGNTIWDAGTDGAGSGLDADLLDGRQSDEFALRSGADFTGKVTVAGSLGLGVGVPYSPLHLRRADQGEARITVENVATGGRAWQIVAGVHNTSQGDFSIFDASAGVTRLTVDTAGVVRFSGALAWTGANDGAGSGLDADLLDGREASDFALLSGSRFSGLVRFQSQEAVRLTGKDGFIAFYSADEQSRRGYLQFYGTSGALVNDGGGALHLQTGGTNVLTAGPGGVAITGGLSRGGNVVWDAGNDGAGSGLDADLLDGWERDAVRDWNNILNRPAAFPPGAHTHGAADLADAFTGALSDNGYTVLPNGLILQWVTGAQQAAGSETTQTVIFPIAFNTCFQVIAATQAAYADKESHAIYQLISFTNEAATVMRQLDSTAATDSAASWPRLFAIGR